MKKVVPILVLLMNFYPVFAQSSQERTQTQSATLKYASRLFGEKDDLTSVIMIIPSGSKVTVLDSDSTYFRVKFENDEGYIFKRQAEIDNDIQAPSQANNTSVQVSTTQPAIRETQPELSENQSRFTYLENKYGTSVAARINSGKIWKGMSAEMVKDSWGSPNRLSRIVSGNSMREEWTFKSTILYFENSVLTNWGPATKQ